MFPLPAECLRNPVPYNTVRQKNHLHSADVLLFHPKRNIAGGALIAKAGRSDYSHAGMAAWWNSWCNSQYRDEGSRLMCLDTVAHGGRAVLLSNLVAAAPGRIDVYSPVHSPSLDCWGAVEAMLEITGMEYGYKSLLKVAMLHLPVVRLFTRANRDDTANGSVPHCSQAVSRAYRVGGGVDLVPNLADAHTEPGDLARSAFLEYKFTLM